MLPLFDVSTPQTVFKASLSWATTPTAATSNVPMPKIVASAPWYGRFAAANSVSSAWAPALPSKPATWAEISPWTASGPKTKPATAVLMTSKGPKEKIE